MLQQARGFSGIKWWMIALEVSSAAGRPPYGGIGGAIRHIVGELLQLDPETRYHLCYRLSRWRKGHLFRPDAPNAHIRVLQDPLNALLLAGDRVLHSMGIYVPRTPRITKLVTVHDLNAVRNVQWVSERWHARRSRRIREAVERADHVVTYSEFTATEVRDEYGLAQDRVHPVLLGVDADAHAPASPAEVEKLRAEHGDYVISIGIVTPRKNFGALVRAVAPLDAVRLVLVGRPADAEPAVQDTIRATKMQDRVTRLESVSHADLVALTSAARVCAVPSLYVGFGLGGSGAPPREDLALSGGHLLHVHELLNQLVEGFVVELELALEPTKRDTPMLAQVGLRPCHGVEEAHVDCARVAAFGGMRSGSGRSSSKRARAGSRSSISNSSMCVMRPPLTSRTCRYSLSNAPPSGTSPKRRITVRTPCGAVAGETHPHSPDVDGARSHSTAMLST